MINQIALKKRHKSSKMSLENGVFEHLEFQQSQDLLVLYFQHNENTGIESLEV